MDTKEDIRSRTFGIEIEMCDLDRSKVTLPSGYSWSKDEEIVNTDGSCNKKFGGEVNTPPLRLFSMQDLHNLKDTYNSMSAAGGRIKWSTYTHVHLYAGDLDVGQLKKVFLLFYVCYPYFKRYTGLSDWDELAFNLQPLPTEKYYYGVLNASTLDEIKGVFTNQSKKGFIRHSVNISAYFKTKTIEFRCFHGTDDFYRAMNCVYSVYRFFYYAVEHELDDFKSISSYDEFLKATGLKYKCPPELCPLIYQGNPYSAIETFCTKPMPYNSRYASALWDAVRAHGHKRLCIVNGFMYYYELFFQDKVELSIYCQDPYLHLLYMIANGKTSLKYSGKLEWLEDFNNSTPQRQAAIVLYVSKLQKFNMSDSERNETIIDSLKIRARESIEKTEKSCDRLITMLTTCDYHIGTLQDAVANEKAVFFNYGRDKKQKRVFKLISENSDLFLDFDVKRNSYYELMENLPNDCCFYYISNSPFLRNMHKVAVWDSSSGERRSAGRFLYCNKEIGESKASLSYSSSNMEVCEIIPPDDLRIDDPKLLKIELVESGQLKVLQRKYIKKVDQCSACTFPFIVSYGKYTLGGFGFDLPQHKGFDLFQLTDFSTNNAIPRLAKFILLCIQTRAVQRVLSRKMKKLCKNVLSLAYTHKPVSMKYRGVYKKVDDKCTSSYLAYEGRLGVYETYDDILAKYQKMIKNGNGK